MSSLAFTFLTCVGITLLAGFVMLRARPLQQLSSVLRVPGTVARIGILGLTAGVVYLITFSMIAKVGAGTFNLIDYGLTPLLTATLGVIVMRERWPLSLTIAIPIYLFGLVFLASSPSFPGILAVVICLTSPVATAASDLFTKSLLTRKDQPLTRYEVLFFRFLPTAVLLIPLLAMTKSAQIFPDLTSQQWAVCVLSVIFLGFLPLWLLCKGLESEKLVSLAPFEFLIPALSFIGGVVGRSDRDANAYQFLGAFAILGCFIFVHTPTFKSKKPA